MTSGFRRSSAVSIPRIEFAIRTFDRMSQSSSNCNSCFAIRKSSMSENGESSENTRNDPRFRRFQRTSIRNIGMALTAVSQADGSGVLLARGASRLSSMSRITRSCSRRESRSDASSKRSILRTRLADFVRENAFRGYGTRKYRHAYWTAVWLTYEGIVTRRFFSNATLASIRDGFDALEGSTLVGMRGRAEMRRLKIMTSGERGGSSVGLTGTNDMVNFFKSRPAHTKLLSSVLPKHRAHLKKIADALS